MDNEDILFEKAFNLDSEIVYFPIRHHSPACSWHLIKTMEEYKPECILIEGPENANIFFDAMTDESTQSPTALYYFYRDKKGYISGEKADYRCYYPFTDCSPELNALRYAKENGIKAEFFDLPYAEILIASQEGRGLLEKNGSIGYNDEKFISRSEYIKTLCEKTGTRNFDEFWEKHFEINAQNASTPYFVKQMLIHCYYSRKDSSQEELAAEGCLARERYMAFNISEKKKEYKKILVVTGGFHTYGIINISDSVKKYKLHKIEQENQGAYLIPYSMSAMDSLNGYASGMPYPKFYQDVWEKMQGGSKKPYDETILEYIIKTSAEARKKNETLCAYDEICAWNMSNGLAALRGKAEGGIFELKDSVLSCFVKGEYTISTRIAADALERLMTGSEMGRLCENAQTVPIIKDFEEKCKAFKLKKDTAEHEAVLNIFSMPKHKLESEFFSRLEFMDIMFAKKVKGANLRHKGSRNLVREVWRYKYSENVLSRLVDASFYGSTIYEVCMGMIEERLRESNSSSELARLLVDLFLMNINEDTQRVIKKAEDILINDNDFFSVSQALSYFIMLLEFKELYSNEFDFSKLIRICISKLFILIPNIAGIDAQDEEKCTQALKNVYRIMFRSEFSQYAEDFYDCLEMLVNREDKSNPCVEGCAVGILYGGGRISSEQAQNMAVGYVSGSKSAQGAGFLKGLFSSARDLIFSSDEFIRAIDKFIRNTDNEKFMEILPQMRMSFGYFVPSEIDKISEMVANMYSRTGKTLSRMAEVLPEEYEYGKSLERYAVSAMKKGVDYGK